MNITPDQADQWTHGTTDGPWEPHPDYPTMLVNLDQKMEVAAIPGNPDDCTPEDEANLALIAAAPDLAQTIAGMRWEYGVEQATGTKQWFGSRPMAEAYAEARGAFRLVRRLVGPVEEVTDSE